MFSPQTYTARRAALRTRIGGGLVLLPGNMPSPNNYPNNTYYYRQDSTFLYYFGLDIPSLVGVLDADSGEEMLFGDDFTVDRTKGQISSSSSAERQAVMYSMQYSSCPSIASHARSCSIVCVLSGFIMQLSMPLAIRQQR